MPVAPSVSQDISAGQLLPKPSSESLAAPVVSPEVIHTQRAQNNQNLPSSIIPFFDQDSASSSETTTTPVINQYSNIEAQQLGEQITSSEYLTKEGKQLLTQKLDEQGKTNFSLSLSEVQQVLEIARNANDPEYVSFALQWGG